MADAGQINVNAPSQLQQQDQSQGSGQTEQQSKQAPSTPPQFQLVKINVASDDPIHERIKQAFRIFDTTNTGSCDIREVGTMLRYLDVYPNEIQLADIMRRMEEPESQGVVKLDNFTNVFLTTIYRQLEFVRDDERKIFLAFKSIDKEKKGYLTADELRLLLTSEGDTFSQEEIEEMLSSAIDPIEGKLFYDAYASKLAAY